MVSEQVVKLTSWVRMTPKKNRKQPQGSMLEEPAKDLVAPPESIGEEEPMPREGQDEPESEEEQRSSVVATLALARDQGKGVARLRAYK